MSRPAWTLTEAVERTGASRSTIRRYRDAGKFPNAYKDTAGAWRFPLEDLLAVGLSPSEPARERAQNKPSEQGQSIPTEQANTTSAEQVSKLEQALILERTRAENAERLAASYLDNVQDLRRALRMLEAGISKMEQDTGQAQDMVSDGPTALPVTIPEKPVNKPERPLSDTTLGPTPLWRRLLSRR
jgi:hypothetical protein